MAVPDLSEAGRLVGEDVAHQRRVWRAQRVGWAGMALLIVAALSGAFGRGPLSDARATTGPGGAEVTYERVQRVGADAWIMVTVPRAEDGRDLRLGGSFLSGVEVMSATPPGAVVGRSPDVLVLRPSLAGERDAAVVLRTRPEKPGLFRATLWDGARDASFRILVLP